MLKFVVSRLIQTTLTILIASVGIFAIMHLAPGDPVSLLAGIDAGPEVIAAARHELGLDRPLPVQYASWLRSVLAGDLGRSFFSKYPVTTLIAQRLPATLELTAVSLMLALVIALPLGMLTALHQGGMVDSIVSGLNGVIIGIPSFWLGLILLVVFVGRLQWLPPGGRISPTAHTSQWLRHILMPATTLGLATGAVLLRFVRTAVLDVINQDYIRTAYAKGLSSRSVVVRHALPNALIPIVTVLGIQIGRMLGGAVMIEMLFSYPGVGSLAVTGVLRRDYTVVQGVLTVLVVIFAMVNLLVDVLYGFLDPRVKRG